MGRETRIFKSQEKKSRGEVSTFLRALAEKVDLGSITLSQGTEELLLQFPENVILEVQVEDEEKRSKGVQHSLEIELKWFDNDNQTGSMELK